MAEDFSSLGEQVESNSDDIQLSAKNDPSMQKTISDISAGKPGYPMHWQGQPIGNQKMDFSSQGEKLDLSSLGEPISGKKSSAMQGLEAIEPSAQVTPEQPEEEVFGSKTAGKVKAGVEAGLSTLAGSVTGPIANLLGVAGQALGKGKAEDIARKVGEEITYQPRSETAKRYQENIGKVLDPLTAVFPDLNMMHGATAINRVPKIKGETSTPATPTDPFSKLAEIAQKKEPQQLELPLETKTDIYARKVQEGSTAQRDMFSENAWLPGDPTKVAEEAAKAKEDALRQKPISEMFTKPEQNISPARAALLRKQGGVIHPDLLTMGTAKVWERVGKNVDRLMAAFKGTFTEGAIKRALDDTHDPKSRSTLVLMRPQDFLNLSPSREKFFKEQGYTFGEARQAGEQKRQSIRQGLKTKEGLREIPMLLMDNNEIVGHEGRHRMDVFTEQGMDYVPVVLRDTVKRWGERTDLPQELVNPENGNSVRMPEIMKKGNNLPPQYQGEVNLHSGLNLKQAVDDLLKAHPEIKDFTEALVKQFGEDARSLAPQLYRATSDESTPLTPKELANDFYVKDGIKEAVSTELRQNYEQATASGLTKEMSEKFRDYADKKTSLTPEEKAVYDQYIQPLIDRTNVKLEEAKRYADKDFDVDEAFNPRVALGHFSVWDRILGGHADAFQSPLGKTASILKSRKVFALETADGSRMTITLEGGDVVGWKNGMPTKLGKYSKRSDVSPGEKFQGMNVVEAAERDIMQDSAINYLRDDMAVRTIKLMELEKYVEDQKFLENLMNSPEFNKVAFKTENISEVPEGWRPLANPRSIPKLQDYFFDPKIAETLDDFSKAPSSNKAVQLMDKFNNLAVSSIMLDPIPHINNEMWHYITSRGLIGDWVNPMGLTRIAKTIVPSMESVLRQDAFQKDLMKNGAAMMYPRVANQGWIHNMLVDSSKDIYARDPGFIGAAKALGHSAGEAYQALSSKMAAVMWSARDMMYTSLVKDKMAKGMNMRDAIAEVERHMPAYRIPPRVLEKALGASGSRALSTVMQTPVISVFSRYHYGVLSHIGNSLRDVVTPGRTFKGLDNFATMAAGYALLYPVLDKILQQSAQMMGMDSQDAEELQWRRAGGAHLMELVRKGMDDEVGYASIMTSILTPSPALSTGMGLWNNRDAFTGKENIDLHDPVTIFDTAMSTAGKAFAPARTPQAIAADKMEGSQWAWSFADVEQKTAKKEASIEKAKRYKEYQRRQRQRKRPEWEKEAFD